MNKIQLKRPSNEAREEEARDIMTVEETADYLRLSPCQIYALVRKKLIPATRIGKKIVTSRKVLDEWLELRIRKSIPDEKNRA